MMEERKLTKEDIERMRDIDGFPIAKDEDIIALSHPPYYTACPNPFIEDFIREHGRPYDEETDDYQREPFIADVSEGKNDPMYMAHSYHTKVPYKAIMRYILHYTNPGDIVFDGFCGTGMTGVAAQMCGNPDKEFKFMINTEMPYVKWGARNAILSDLSPAATFIAYNYNTSVDVSAFLQETERILEECEEEYGWMYETEHVDHLGNPIQDKNGRPKMGRINYMVWSDVFICPSCSKEIEYYTAAYHPDTNTMDACFTCPNCGSRLKIADCERAYVTEFDPILSQIVTIAKVIPVHINYSIGTKRYPKKPSNSDIEKLKKIKSMRIPNWIPISELKKGYNTEQPKKSHRYYYVHQFYQYRTLHVLAFLYNKCKGNSKLLFWFTSCLPKLTCMNRYMPQHGSRALVGPMAGTLYVPPLKVENEAISQFKFQSKKIIQVDCPKGNIISTQSASMLTQIPSNTIDYIFTDPPFGGNLNYSELSFFWESWLQNWTNDTTEAVINNEQRKSISEYQSLMSECFAEFYRVLKPNHWITVEFHNSQNAVWNTLQESLSAAGFVIADIRILDKQKGTIKQLSTQSAVKQDLIISAYKPREAFTRQFTEQAGDPEMVWEFVRQHLQNVPIAPDSTGKIEVVNERQDYLLFDRMVAYHIMNGIPVPIDAHTFYAGLRERFIQRDGMFFLPDQVNEYDERRQKMELQDQQISLFVTDEKSAIIWLNVQLSQARQSYSEIQPKFLQVWNRNKFEQMPELLDMLKENFLQDEDGKWYVPDLSDKADLEKLRRKRLLKDFYDIYAKGTGRIKNARTEAIRVGFDECWKERNYSLIVKVGDRLPESILQEDPALLMYYNNAASRL